MMKYVYLGKENVDSMDDVHDIFAEAFDFPAYYGRNLDAMYDCLSEVFEDSLIVIADKDELALRLGEKFDAFLQLLEDALLDNLALSVRFVE